MLKKRAQTKEQSKRNAAHSSAILLGLALPPLLAQSAQICQTAALSPFGWALFTALSGCLACTILNWSTLLNTPLPERETWKRAILAGVLVAIGLFLLGTAISSPQWSPLNALTIMFVPWSREMWRSVLGTEPIPDTKSRIASLTMILAATLFVWPEMQFFFKSGAINPNELLSWPQLGFPQAPLPRSLSFLSAICFGAASALQRAQDRSISSATFWTMPTAIAAILLSLAGWLSLQIATERELLIGKLNATGHANRFFLTGPALLFGVLLLAIRPRIHIKNALTIGRNSNIWWHSLGLGSGTAVTLLLTSDQSFFIQESLFFTLVLVSQFIATNGRQNSITFAPTLSIVPESGVESVVLSSRQNP